MNRRYFGWVLFKSIFGSLLMFDSFLVAARFAPGMNIAKAVIETGGTATLFAGWFLIFTAVIGGMGLFTENYHLKEGSH